MGPAQSSLKRPCRRVGQWLFLVWVLFATALEQKSYVSMSMYQPVSSVAGPGWQYRDFGNLVMYDVGGLLRFLYTEVLHEGGAHRDLDEVVVWHLKVLNPPTVVSAEHQWEFAPYIHFTNGAVDATGGTTAEDALSRLAELGDQVGIQAFRPGSADPRFAWDGTYYSFSVSGPCPNLKDVERGVFGMYTMYPHCRRYDNTTTIIKGTRCEADLSIPDGSQGCVVVAESAEVLNLGKLVGIRQEDCGGRPCESLEDFRSNCADAAYTHNGQRYCREYSAHPDCSSSCESDTIDCKVAGDNGLKFWRGRCDASRNFERSQAILAQQLDVESRLRKQYMNSPSCSQHVGCSSPNVQEGTGYCHRDASGVCDACFVPGTINAGSPSLGQPRCRLDLFSDPAPEYRQQLPRCSTSCGGRCSLETDADACCLYIGACTRSPDWEVGEWSACSSSCSQGTRSRKVSCPFAEEVGQCNESTKPREIETCQGNRCPWDVEGGWEACDNPCGFGTHSKRPFCPFGADQCAGNAIPRPESRECYGMSRRHPYCRQCSADLTTCSECVSGFTLHSGHCVNRHSFVETTFHVNTAAGRLEERSDIFASVAPAMERSLSSMDLSASVVAMEIIEDDTTNSGNMYVTLAVTVPGTESMEGEETMPQANATLLRLKEQLQHLSFESLRKKMTNVLQRSFSPGLAAILGVDRMSTRKFCPDLRNWDQDTGSCGDPPQFLLTVSTTGSSREESTTGGDSANGNEHKAFAEEGIQKSSDVSADLEMHVDKDAALEQESSSAPAPEESGKLQRSWMPWAIAGGSLGVAAAAGLAIIVAIARSKKGSSDEAEPFTNGAGTSS